MMVGSTGSTSTPLQDLKAYYKAVAAGKISPKDPFALSYAFLQQDENNILVGDLADKQAMLSYLGDDMMVQFYQNDIDILTRMRNMGLRDEKLLPVFATTYYGWLGTLKITRAKDGIERQLQATAVGGYNPASTQLTGGYGGQFADQIRQSEADAKNNNPIKNLFSKLGIGKKK
jgi:hypothetical protein